MDVFRFALNGEGGISINRYASQVEPKTKGEPNLIIIPQGAVII